MYKLKQGLKEFKRKFIDWFQYHGKFIYCHGDGYTKYLSKRKYRLMGVKKIVTHEEYTSFIDKRKNEFVIVETSLKKQNGSNDIIDNENYKQCVNALDNIKGICKIVLKANRMNRLQSNINFMYGLYEKENDQEIKEDMLERIRYNEQLNKRGEMLCYLYIKESELDQVLVKLSTLFYCKVLNKEDLIKFIFEIHNVERSGF